MGDARQVSNASLVWYGGAVGSVRAGEGLRRRRGRAGEDHAKPRYDRSISGSLRYFGRVPST